MSRTWLVLSLAIMLSVPRVAHAQTFEVCYSRACCERAAKEKKPPPQGCPGAKPSKIAGGATLVCYTKDCCDRAAAAGDPPPQGCPGAKPSKVAGGAKPVCYTKACCDAAAAKKEPLPQGCSANQSKKACISSTSLDHCDRNAECCSGCCNDYFHICGVPAPCTGTPEKQCCPLTSSGGAEAVCYTKECCDAAVRKKEPLPKGCTADSNGKPCVKGLDHCDHNSDCCSGCCNWLFNICGTPTPCKADPNKQCCPI